MTLKKTGTFHFFASTLGNGAGTFNINKDDSPLTIDAFIAPIPIAVNARAPERMIITSMIILIQQQGIFMPERYGAMPALTNGIEILMLDSDGQTIQDFTNGDPIKTNAQWGGLAHDMIYIDWPGGENHITVKWQFDSPIVLNGKRGEKFVLRLHDDFTALSRHTAIFQGFYEN